MQGIIRWNVSNEQTASKTGKCLVSEGRFSKKHQNTMIVLNLQRCIIVGWSLGHRLMLFTGTSFQIWKRDVKRYFLYFWCAQGPSLDEGETWEEVHLICLQAPTEHQSAPVTLILLLRSRYNISHSRLHDCRLDSSNALAWVQYTNAINLHSELLEGHSWNPITGNLTAMTPGQLDKKELYRWYSLGS